MPRLKQGVFVAGLLALSWLSMMALHELGHVLGAIISGGAVQQVILHPLSISRTDVEPNPHPIFVVWLGPIFGSILPSAVWPIIPTRLKEIRNISMFFAGFCLIANGAYIGFGSFDAIGDCGTMLQHGSPPWLLLAFGCAAICLGFFTWHRLGSIKDFIDKPFEMNDRLIVAIVGALVVVVALGTFS